MAITSIPGGGNHNVTVYGNGTVDGGSGNLGVSVGVNGIITVGNGKDTISVGGNGTVNAGSGNSAITVAGKGQITVGGGSDTITLYGSGQIAQNGVPGHDTINLGSGNDTIVVQGNATVKSAAFSPHTYSLAASAAFGGASISGGSLSVNHLNGISQDIAVNGKMTLLGGSGATEFVGGTGTTAMRGISGHDTFVGGSGHDTMTGVGNHNVFEFLATAQGGQHVISNFVTGDTLNVEGHSLTYLLSHNEVTSHGGNTYISVDGGKTTVELQGVSESAGPVRAGTQLPDQVMNPIRHIESIHEDRSY